MLPSLQIIQQSCLYLNQFATRLSLTPSSYIVHYWGGKPEHYGNIDHSHSFLEVCYVLDGEGSYTRNGMRYVLKRGTLYATSPGHRHHLESNEGLLLLFVAFEIDKRATHSDTVKRYESLCKQEQLFIPDASGSPVVHLWMSLLLLSGKSDRPDPIIIERIAHTLLTCALALFDAQHGTLLTDSSCPLIPAKVTLTDAMAFIQRHLSEKLTLKEVAQHLYVSERHLSRLLSESLGQSFSAWVRTERIRTAAYLLAYTDKNLITIAEETGFETPSYFHRVFSQTLRMTPGQFRRMIASRENNTQETLHSFLDLLVARHKNRVTI
jgi:AraC-like DNA-binding protein